MFIESHTSTHTHGRSYNRTAHSSYRPSISYLTHIALYGDILFSPLFTLFFHWNESATHINATVNAADRPHDSLHCCHHQDPQAHRRRNASFTVALSIAAQIHLIKLSTNLRCHCGCRGGSTPGLRQLHYWFVFNKF